MRDKKKPIRRETASPRQNIWSNGLEQNSKWIDSDTYSCRESLSGISSTEPILTDWINKGSIMTYSINRNMSPKYKLSTLDYEIIGRIGASRGLTSTQLHRYLLLQGYSLEYVELDERLSSLHYSGYINQFVVKDTITREQSIYVSLRRSSYDVCKSMNIEAGEREWISKVCIGSEMDFVIRNIIANQIILNMLSKGHRKFCFSRAATYVLRGVKTHHFPLVIGVNGYSYYIEIAKGGDLETKYIRNAFDVLFKTLPKKDHSRFVFVCDNASKMGQLSMYFYKYLGESIQSRTFYSYTDEWNKESCGSIYEYVNLDSMKKINILNMK